jgi:RNA polymerase sigma factor (sigma-70 family)
MSEEEFAEYVRTNYDRFVRFARVFVGQQAEDVVQGAALNLFAVCDTIDAERPDPLFFTVLRREALDVLRREQSRPRREGAAARSEADTHTPEQAAREREMLLLLRACLADARQGLTPRERRSLAVWLGEHPSREQAAELLGVTAASYSGAVHTGLRKLTAALAPHQAVLLQALEELGYARTFAALAEAFRGDGPQRDPRGGSGGA